VTSAEKEPPMPKETVFGSYVNIFEDRQSLNLTFSLSAMEVANFWSRCGLIANFCASYMAVAMPSRKNITNSLSFVLNELLENALKYAQPKESAIDFAILQKDNSVIIEIANQISEDQVEPLLDMAKNLIDTDYVNAKYIDLLTTSGKSSDKSGIGLLTVINYYQAQMSFKIGSPAEGGHNKYSIQAKVNLEEL